MSYWTHPKPVRRTRAVDVTELARTAVDLLDEGGLRALTVRAAAGRLGVAPASLYSRIDSVDDLFDLALDHALGDDQSVTEALTTADLTGLMYRYFRHLVRHRWACQVIAMRAPRGPHYLKLSERMVALLRDAGVPDPLGTAYTLSNFVIGSATTAQMTDDERAAPVDPDLAPGYAALHATHRVDDDCLVIAGLTALRDQAVPTDDG